MTESTTTTTTTTSVAIVDNNSGVPLGVHISVTILVCLVFVISLNQTCILSINDKLFKYRFGVFVCGAVLCVLSIVLNFDLAKDRGLIALDESFVLIVRVLMVIWLIVACCMGYFFILHGLNIIFINSKKKQALVVISRIWASLTISQIIICLVCFFIAFIKIDNYPLKILFTSAFCFTIAGALLTLIPLIFVQSHVSLSLTHKSNSIELKQAQQMIMTMIAMCVVAIVGCCFNLYYLIANLVATAPRAGSLYSTVLDNSFDYMSYMLICVFYQIALLFWTWKYKSLNYCIFCCCYARYTAHVYQSIAVDRETMCFTLCQTCIEKADAKRQTIILEMKASTNASANANPNANANGATIALTTHQMDGHGHAHENGNGNHAHRDTMDTQMSPSTVINGRPRTITHMFSLSNAATMSASVAQNANATEMGVVGVLHISMVVYDFDSVLTIEPFRVFEQWSEQELHLLSQSQLYTTFGNESRIQHLRTHFQLLCANRVQLVCLSQESCSQTWQILSRLRFAKLFVRTTDEEEENTLDHHKHLRQSLESGCIGSDHQVMVAHNKSIKILLMKLLQRRNDGLLDISHDILYVSADRERVRHFSDINLCQTYHCSNRGLSALDLQTIQKLVLRDKN